MAVEKLRGLLEPIGGAVGSWLFHVEQRHASLRNLVLVFYVEQLGDLDRGN
jgi:hypothetical protein